MTVINLAELLAMNLGKRHRDQYRQILAQGRIVLTIGKESNGCTVIYIMRSRSRFYFCELTDNGFLHITPITKNDFRKLRSGDIGIGNILSKNLVVTDGNAIYATGFKTIFDSPLASHLYSLSRVDWRNPTLAKEADYLLEHWNEIRLNKCNK